MENEEIIDVEIEEPTVVLPIVDDNVLTPRMFTQIMLRSDKWLNFITIANYISMLMMSFVVIGILLYARDNMSLGVMLISIALMCVLLWYWLTITNLLSHAGKSVKAIQTDPSIGHVNEFLYCLSRFFKLTGIGLAIYLFLAALYIILANVLPLFVK
ncbi:MAG: hypothetical protein CVU48_02265 [Candidatus Cloacimonetes bacterium HGW-Cloacimonetes-1]|nr:MAG: hypothetical protein CVU48_02265 [Candidatus Cloacimonetes bacterium HGW-Cloacimonetes-1]